MEFGELIVFWGLDTHQDDAEDLLVANPNHQLEDEEGEGEGEEEEAQNPPDSDPGSDESGGKEMK